MKKQVLQAKTFTPLYDELEDRIRFIINYREPDKRVDLMITRSFMIKIVPFLEDYLQTNFNIQQYNIENSTYHQEKTDIQHIDSIVKEELLKKINISINQSKKIIEMNFISNTTEVKVNIDAGLLKNLVDNLKKSIPKYSWGLHF